MNLLERLLGKKKEGSGAINTASPTALSRPAPQQNQTGTEKKRRILIAKCLEVLKNQMDAHMNESVFVPCSVSCDFPGTKNKAYLRVIPDESDKAICRLTASAVRKGNDLCVMNYLFKGTWQEMKEWLSVDAHVEELTGYMRLMYSEINSMPYLYLLAMRDELQEAFCLAFEGVDNVEVIQADFTAFMDAHSAVDGIVSPANSFGMMTGGLDKALRDYFGMELQNAVQEIILKEHFGEQTVGTSISVDIPGFPGKKLFHTPTMRTPSAIIDYETVYLCMRSALMAAIKSGVKFLMVPAFGGSTGQVPEKIIAQNMRAAYDQIKDQLECPHQETFRTARKRNVIKEMDSRD